MLQPVRAGVHQAESRPARGAQASLRRKAGLPDGVLLLGGNLHTHVSYSLWTPLGLRSLSPPLASAPLCSGGPHSFLFPSTHHAEFHFLFSFLYLYLTVSPPRASTGSYLVPSKAPSPYSRCMELPLNEQMVEKSKQPHELGISALSHTHFTARRPGFGENVPKVTQLASGKW